MLQVRHSFNDEFVIVLKSESKAGLSVQQQGDPRTAELQFTQAIFSYMHQEMRNNSLLNSTIESHFTWLHITEYTIFTVVFVISVVGNVLVCLVIFNTPRMRTTRNYLLVNLAVSDLTVALLCIPFDVVLKVAQPYWPLGAAMCNILWPAMTLVTNCSSFTLAAISLDR